MAGLGFRAQKGESEADLDSYRGKYVAVSAHGSTHLGMLTYCGKGHLALLPCVVSEPLPGDINARLRLEEETPGRVDFPINSVYPTTREYLEEVVRRSQRIIDEGTK